MANSTAGHDISGNIVLPPALLREFSTSRETRWQPSRRATVQEIFPLDGIDVPPVPAEPLRRAQTTTVDARTQETNTRPERPVFDRKTSQPVGRRSWLRTGTQGQALRAASIGSRLLPYGSIDAQSIQAEEHFSVGALHGLQPSHRVSRQSAVNSTRPGAPTSHRYSRQSVVGSTKHQRFSIVRRGSIQDVYEKAKSKAQSFQRKRWAQVVFEYAVYLLLVCFVYFVLIVSPTQRPLTASLYVDLSRDFLCGKGLCTGFGGL